MRIQIWCILAPVFLVSVKASLHENVAQSFYETPQSSSPSPVSDYTQSPQLDGMKAIVLYLTPDQVNALQAAGAVVQPYPEDEVDFTAQDQQLPQKPERRQHYQMQWNPNQNLQLNSEIQNYYKLLDIQEINDNLSQTTEATIRTTERTTTPRYRFTSTTTRPRFKEREYSTPAVPKRKASTTNNFNQNINIQRTPFQYHYINANFRNVPSNILTQYNNPFPQNNPSAKITSSLFSNPSPNLTPTSSRTEFSNQNRNTEHTTNFQYYYENEKFRNTPSNILNPYNSPSQNNPKPKINSSPDIAPSLYRTSTPKVIPNSSRTNYSNQKSNIETTTHFQYYYENKNFRNTPSNIFTPYNNPSPKNTPSPYNIPNSYKATSPKINPNPYKSPSLQIIPSSYSTPSPSITPSTYSTPSPSITPSSYSTANPYTTPTHLSQSFYQLEEKQPTTYFQSSKDIQGDPNPQRPSSDPSPYSTPRSEITPSPKNTPNPYSTPRSYETSTRLSQPLYQSERKQSDNYFQSNKEIQVNQNHQSPSSAPSPYSTPRPEITPSPKNTSSSYSTLSSIETPSRLPQSLYQPEKKQRNNYFQSDKEIQVNQNNQSSSSPYSTPRTYTTPSAKKTPRPYSTPSSYKSSTRLPQSLYQSEKKQRNNYFQSSKKVQGNQNPQNASIPHSPYNSPRTEVTPSPKSTPSPYTTSARLPQPEKEQSDNHFEPSKGIQRKQYQRPDPAAHQNESETTENVEHSDFTSSGTNSDDDENVCTEEITEPQSKANPPTVEIGNKRVNKYSARNLYRPAAPVRVQEAQESLKPQTLVEVPPSYIAQTSEPISNTRLEENTTVHTEPHGSNESVISSSQEEQDTPIIPALPPLVRIPLAKEDYLSLLLAPLYKHQAVSDIVSQYKDDLTRSETNSNSKLQHLKSHIYLNTKENKAGLETLPVDFSEGIALAKHEAVTRSPSVDVNKNSETMETSQYLAEKNEFPKEEHVSKPQDVLISSPNPIPIELIHQFPTEEKVVNIGGGRNLFARTEKPLAIQTVAPLRLKHTTPESIPSSEANAPILRPIWEH